MGNWRERCPYTIHCNSPSKETRNEVAEASGDRSCETCAMDKPKAEVGPNIAMQEDVQDVVKMYMTVHTVLW